MARLWPHVLNYVLSLLGHSWWLIYSIHLEKTRPFSNPTLHRWEDRHNQTIQLSYTHTRFSFTSISECNTHGEKVRNRKKQRDKYCTSRKVNWKRKEIVRQWGRRVWSIERNIDKNIIYRDILENKMKKYSWILHKLTQRIKCGSEGETEWNKVCLQIWTRRGGILTHPSVLNSKHKQK